MLALGDIDAVDINVISKIIVRLKADHYRLQTGRTKIPEDDPLHPPFSVAGNKTAGRCAR